MPRPLTRHDYRTLSLAALGGALEFYDFVIYVFLAPVIGRLFFPADMPDWLRLLQTFGIFSAGYLARPLGGILIAPFRRSARPQADVHAEHLPDGGADAGDRPAADLREHRHRGAAAAAADAHPAGRGDRRRGARRLGVRRRARAGTALRLRHRHAHRGADRRHPVRIADGGRDQHRLRPGRRRRASPGASRSSSAACSASSRSTCAGSSRRRRSSRR